jgi:hypothetical protein
MEACMEQNCRPKEGMNTLVENLKIKPQAHDVGGKTIIEAVKQHSWIIYMYLYINGKRGLEQGNMNGYEISDTP